MVRLNGNGPVGHYRIPGAAVHYPSAAAIAM